MHAGLAHLLQIATHARDDARARLHAHAAGRGRGRRPASVAGDEIDYGSPFDAAYGLDPTDAAWLPEPLAVTTAGLARPPHAGRRGSVPWGRIVAAVEVMLVCGLAGYLLADPAGQATGSAASSTRDAGAAAAAAAPPTPGASAGQRAAAGGAQVAHPRAGVPVVIADAGAHPGALRRAIRATRDLGYPIGQVVAIGTAPDPATGGRAADGASAVLFMPGWSDEALVAGADLSIAHVAPASGLAAGIASHAALVIVVGPDHGAGRAKAG